MDKEDIIRMARVAGFEQGLIRFSADAESIEFFAAIIAAAEREECIGDCNAEASAEGIAQRIIERIRARGQG